MVSKQKAKGKYFESKIASMICKHLDLAAYECKRAPFSGNEQYEFGDIFFADPNKYGIIIECKFHNDWDMRSIWPTVGAKFISFLDELNAACDKYKLKFDKDPIFAGVVFSKPYYDIYVLSWFDIETKAKMRCNSIYNQLPLYVYLLDDILVELRRKLW